MSYKGVNDFFDLVSNGTLCSYKFQEGWKQYVNVAREGGMTALHIASNQGNVGIVRELLNQGADVNQASDYGLTPLHLACQGMHTLVPHTLVPSTLLNAGANVNAVSNTGTTPLNCAHSSGNSLLMEYLLSRGATINVKKMEHEALLVFANRFGHASLLTRIEGQLLMQATNEGCAETVQRYIAQEHLNPAFVSSLLPNACAKGHLNIVKLLVTHGVSVGVRGNLDMTALHLACQNGSIDTVKYLLAMKADINAQDAKDRSPLHMAILQGSLAIVTRLLDEGSDIHLQGDDPLHLATKQNSLEIVEMLLARGAWIDKKDKLGWTCNHIASHLGFKKMLLLLLERGAALKPLTNLGETPLQLAKRSGNKNYVLVLLEGELLIAAVKEGNFQEVNTICSVSNSNYEDRNGASPLQRACEIGHKNIIKVLLTKGAKINQKDVNGMTPLHWTCKKGHDTVAAYLLENGADISAKTIIGHTALHLATPFKRMVHLLIKKGGDVNAKDCKQMTPLHWACSNGSLTSSNILLKKGAIMDAISTEGRTPLMEARDNGNADLIRMFEKLLGNEEKVNLVNEVVLSDETSMKGEKEIGRMVQISTDKDKGVSLETEKSKNIPLTPKIAEKANRCRHGNTVSIEQVKEIKEKDKGSAASLQKDKGSVRIMDIKGKDKGAAASLRIIDTKDKDRGPAVSLGKDKESVRIMDTKDKDKGIAVQLEKDKGSARIIETKDKNKASVASLEKESVRITGMKDKNKGFVVSFEKDKGVREPAPVANTLETANACQDTNTTVPEKTIQVKTKYKEIDLSLVEDKGSLRKEKGNGCQDNSTTSIEKITETEVLNASLCKEKRDPRTLTLEMSTKSGKQMKETVAYRAAGNSRVNSGDSESSNPGQYDGLENETAKKGISRSLEVWDLKHIFSSHEIINADQQCTTRDCTLFACCTYKSSQSKICHVCLDCQLKEFGGWPPRDMLPLKIMTLDHWETISTWCSNEAAPMMPRIIAIREKPSSLSSISPKRNNSNSKTSSNDSGNQKKISMTEKKRRYIASYATNPSEKESGRGTLSSKLPLITIDAEEPTHQDLRSQTSNHRKKRRRLARHSSFDESMCCSMESKLAAALYELGTEFDQSLSHSTQLTKAEKILYGMRKRGRFVDRVNNLIDTLDLRPMSIDNVDSLDALVYDILFEVGLKFNRSKGILGQIEMAEETFYGKIISGRLIDRVNSFRNELGLDPENG